MAFVAFDPIVGSVDLTIVDPAGPGLFTIGGAAGRQSAYLTELRGYDPGLGAGTFIYAKAGNTTAVGDWCSLDYSLTSGVITTTAVKWAGTANTGQPLCVAMTVLTTSQWGWFQVQGNCIAASSGTVAKADKVYWQASGVVSSTAVAGKQVLNAGAATANAVTINGTALATGFSVYTINRPFVQGQIT
jgi:hypothetical protein